MRRENRRKMIAQKRAGSGETKSLFSRSANLRRHFVDSAEERFDKTKKFNSRTR